MAAPNAPGVPDGLRALWAAGETVTSQQTAVRRHSLSPPLPTGIRSQRTALCGRSRHGRRPPPARRPHDRRPATTKRPAWHFTATPSYPRSARSCYSPGCATCSVSAAGGSTRHLRPACRPDGSRRDRLVLGAGRLRPGGTVRPERGGGPQRGRHRCPDLPTAKPQSSYLAATMVTRLSASAACRANWRTAWRRTDRTAWRHFRSSGASRQPKNMFVAGGMTCTLRPRDDYGYSAFPWSGQRSS